MPKQGLNEAIIACKQCPRLIKYCKAIAIEKRKSYENQNYWGKPVPNFGEAKAKLLIVGLAPAAHGANRTGRMFTGDRSGEWLYRALHKASFANQPSTTTANDGLKLKNALITAVAHCAPPDNKPETSEILRCKTFLTRTFEETPFQIVLALGGIAWKASVEQLKKMELLEEKSPKFSQAAEIKLTDGRFLIGSYHPSQQNTFTGRLTEPMFDRVFSRSREIIEILA